MKKTYCIDYSLTQAHLDELLMPNRGLTVISPTGSIQRVLSQFREEAKKFGFSESLAYTSTGVSQNFQAFSDFKADDEWISFGLHISESLRLGFERLGHSHLFKMPLALSDLTLQFYPQSKPDDQFALSAHRDQSGFINLVVVLLIEGPSTFFICRDRIGTTPIEPVEIEAVPGDLMVMRAGDFGDNLPRPCHFVGRVENPQGRLTLALRQISNDPARVKKLEHFFGRKFGSGSKMPH